MSEDQKSVSKGSTELDGVLSARNALKQQREAEYLARIEQAKHARNEYYAEFKRVFEESIRPVMSAFIESFRKHGHELSLTMEDFELTAVEPRVLYTLRMDGERYNEVHVHFMGKGKERNVLFYIESSNRNKITQAFQFGELNRSKVEEVLLRMFTSETRQ